MSESLADYLGDSAVQVRDKCLDVSQEAEQDTGSSRETSINAYLKKKASGDLRERERQALKGLQQYHNAADKWATASELQIFLQDTREGWTQFNDASAALSRLKNKGYVREHKKRECGQTHRVKYSWIPTSEVDNRE